MANDVRWLQIAGALAAAAIVFLVTVLFRGNKVQRFLAAVLIVIPLIHLIGVFSEAIGYAFRW